MICIKKNNIGVNKELLIKELLSLDKICKEDDYQEKEWWFCKKCNKKIIEGDYHRKYCNSKKEKHKHKLLPDYTKQFVKNK